MTMPKREYEYRNISIPKDLIRQAESLLDELESQGFGQGYQSIAEFVKDAIRARITFLRQAYFLGEAGEQG